MALLQPRKHFPFLHLCVLFGPSTDYSSEVDLYSVYQSQFESLQKHPHSYSQKECLPTLWLSLCPFKLTCKINHHDIQSASPSVLPCSKARRPLVDGLFLCSLIVFFLTTAYKGILLNCHVNQVNSLLKHIGLFPILLKIKTKCF